MPNQNNIILVMAAYNEEKKIKEVVNDVSRYVDKIIVVDDGSSDNTANAVKNKKATVIKHRINLGQGAALQTGFDYAKTLKPQVVITYDADGQFEPSDIPMMINPILNGEADVVLGSRFLGTVENLGLIRRLILKAGVIFTYIFSEIKLTDTHNGFRAMNLKTLNYIHLTQDRMAHASEIIDQIVGCGARYLEVPVTVRYNDYTKGKKNQSNLNAIKIAFNLIFSRLY